LNIRKTKAIMFQAINNDQGKYKCMKINEQELEWEQSVKYLGVTLDRNIRMGCHFETISNKVMGMRVLLSPILRSNSTPKEIKRQIYESYLLPVLTYASSAWVGLLTKTRLNKLEKQERKLLRSIFRTKKEEGNKKLYRITGITPIKERVKEMADKYYENISDSDRVILKELTQFQTITRKYKMPGDVLNIE
jgi:hypothetical protein